MSFEEQLGWAAIINIAIVVLAIVIGWVLLYLAIRLGVSHGLRGHTRWIDNGKDYEKLP